ncbi:hypothetical protein [Fulvivirga lutimaris]|uniref:hypothetical protein n=1 Tax=Fulvivirga lutimaris TaxID=1819566 RepID=UPI0012BCB6B2|nr:hypothetical protein [Fulvivirga lutimaris]MTI38404.1 hypothetical protein [Fulvivirga lutimaris]
MKRITFYPSMWPVPYKLDEAPNFFQNGERVQELVLNNSSNVTADVSQMNLNITKFSAIDDNGQESTIKDFSGKTSVTFKGMGTGHYIKTASVLALAPGTYTTLRYYLNNEDNSFVKSNGEVVAANNIDYIDFEIENGLIINGNESLEVKLYFDFAPFKLSSYFKPLTDWFRSKNLLNANWPEVVLNYLD